MRFPVELAPDAAASLRRLPASERGPVMAALDRLMEAGLENPAGEAWVELEAGTCLVVCVPRRGRGVLVAAIEASSLERALVDAAGAPARRLMRTVRGDQEPRGPRSRRSVTGGHSRESRTRLMDMFSEMRQGARALRRDAGIAVMAVAALAIGIGVPAAVFGLVDATVLRGLPIEDARRILHMERRPEGRTGEGWGVPAHDVLVWREQQRSFESIEAFDFREVTVRSGQSADRYRAAVLTPGSFEALRVRATEGRTLQAADAEPGAPPVVVIGHAMRRDRFAGESNVTGRTLIIDGAPHEVVGVMPEGFAFPAAEQLWLPLSLAGLQGEEAMAPTLDAFGRLRPGADIEGARAELGLIAARLAERLPETHATLGVAVKPFTVRFVGETATTTMYFVLGAVMLVLLVACANVANLLLVRAVKRSRDLAVHSALGATRGRIARQLLMESLVLAAAGGLGGIAIAAAGLGGLARLIGDRLPYWAVPRLDATVVLFVLGLVVLATLLAGLLPALRAGGGDLSATLRDESRGSTGRRTNRVMAGLVSLEIALSLALLAGTGLLGRSVRAVQPERLGISYEDIVTARVSPPADRDAAARLLYYRALETELRRDPGAAAVGLGSVLPVSHAPGVRLAREGEAYERPEAQPVARYAAVTPGWFATYRVQPVQGRLVEDADGPATLPVAVVNESFVRRHFGGRNPIGERIGIGAAADATWRTIVGVVPDLWAGSLDSSPDRNPPAVYVPFAQAPPATAAIAVQVRTEPLAFVPALRAAAFQTEPDVPLHDVATMARVIEDNSWFYGLAAWIFAVCGAATLLLATVGTYGVIAFAVGRRTREFGVRLAMGAQPGDILRLVVGKGATQVVIGMLIGLGLALVIARGLGSLLFEVTGTDPLVMGGTVLVLAAVALLAMLIPARRASRADPVTALRAE